MDRWCDGESIIGEERDSVTNGQDEMATMKVRAVLGSILPLFFRFFSNGTNEGYEEGNR